jgi:hypothetical protein
MSHPTFPLVINCVAYERDGQWQAFSLQFGLAAQEDSFDAAKRKLDRMISAYVYDALVGEDREHAEELLSRRATSSVYVCYYLAKVMHVLRRSFSAKTFAEPVRLAPQTAL